MIQYLGKRNKLYNIYFEVLDSIILSHETPCTLSYYVCVNKPYNARHKWRQNSSSGIVQHCLNIHLLHSTEFLQNKTHANSCTLRIIIQVQVNINLKSYFISYSVNDLLEVLYDYQNKQYVKVNGWISNLLDIY